LSEEGLTGLELEVAGHSSWLVRSTGVSEIGEAPDGFSTERPTAWQPSWLWSTTRARPGTGRRGDGTPGENARRYCRDAKPARKERLVLFRLAGEHGLTEIVVGGALFWTSRASSARPAA
jgi:hypothetical protein